MQNDENVAAKGAKAMADGVRCAQRVLVYLDDRALALRRVWCLYEVWMALKVLLYYLLPTGLAFACAAVVICNVDMGVEPDATCATCGLAAVSLQRTRCHGSCSCNCGHRKHGRCAQNVITDCTHKAGSSQGAHLQSPSVPSEPAAHHTMQRNTHGHILIYAQFLHSLSVANFIQVEQPIELATAASRAQLLSMMASIRIERANAKNPSDKKMVMDGIVASGMSLDQINSQLEEAIARLMRDRA